MRSRWWFLIGLALLASSLLAGCATSSAATDFVASGPPAPLPRGGVLTDASVDDFEAILVGARGLPVVVNVWASWCPPCRSEAPLLQRAANDYEGEVVFIGVASRDRRGAAEGFMDRYELTYPNLLDTSGDIRGALGMRAFPTTYVFDRDGRIIAADVGGVSEQTLAAQLEDALRS